MSSNGQVNIEPKYALSDCLQNEFDKSGFESFLSKYNGRFYIEISLDTPHHYHWVGELCLPDLRDVLMSHIAEEILAFWNDFDPKEFAKTLEEEKNYGGYEGVDEKDFAADAKFLDDKLEELCDNIAKYFECRNQALKKVRISKKKSEPDSLTL